MAEFASALDLFAAVYEMAGMPVDEARDLVILRCLEGGDASAFSYFVLAGHHPGAEVLRFLAFMTSAGDPPPAVAERVPFRLTASSRAAGKRGRRPDPLLVMADEVLALNVSTLMGDERGRYDAAITEVASWVSEGKAGAGGLPIKHQTVRDAYDKRRGDGQGKK